MDKNCSPTVKTLIDSSIGNLTPWPAAAAYDLTAETLRQLESFFAAHTSHLPSPKIMSALREVTKVLAGMAEGSLRPQIYVSSLDPGIGKTRTVVSFVHALMRGKAKGMCEDAGVILCLPRLSEIEAVYSELEGYGNEVAVLTSSEELNARGASDASAATVLLTTQQMVSVRTETCDFSDVAEFFYEGRPRTVRVWDESILPGRTVTLTTDQVKHVLDASRRFSPALGDAIDQLARELDCTKAPSKSRVPEVVEDIGKALLCESEVLSVRERAILEDLVAIAGRHVTISVENARGPVVLSYKETLPTDIGPVLVLDASARIRKTYEEWEKGRGGIQRLPGAEKNYSKLSMHVWDTGGGKSAFRSKQHELTDGILETVNARPNEKWLVVGHKPNRYYDVESLLRAGFEGPEENLEFLPWGRHDATNEFADFPNVILAGTLFYPNAHYRALTKLSAGLCAGKRVSAERANQIAHGEHAHLILQALCRAQVRQCKGDEAKECNAYVIASKLSGIRELLPTLFPGCDIKEWKPSTEKPRGRVKESLERIQRWLSCGGKGLLTFSDVYKAIGVSSANFRKNVRKHEVFRNYLERLGVYEWEEAGKMRGFVLKGNEASVYGF